jgi:hypothetical protein
VRDRAQERLTRSPERISASSASLSRDRSIATASSGQRRQEPATHDDLRVAEAGSRSSDAAVDLERERLAVAALRPEPNRFTPRRRAPRRAAADPVELEVPAREQVACDSASKAASRSPVRRRLRERARAASSLTTTAVTEYAASANQFDESCSVNVWTGVRKKKLNASMLATATGSDQRMPQSTATGSTANM